MEYFKKTMKLGMFAFLLIALFSQLIAQNSQTYTIKGQVLSLLDGLPMPEVKVYLKGTTLSTATDKNGVFRISNVPTGVYDVMAQYSDFNATILKDIAVPPGTQKEFVFNLAPKDHEPIPYVDVPAASNAATLNGTVTAKIDTFRNFFSDGRLFLKMSRVGDLLESYLYPRLWEILPVAEQEFRFKFHVPAGVKYRLYLIWQVEHKDYVFEQIVDVARVQDNAKAARIFDLTSPKEISGVRLELNTVKLRYQ